MKSIRKILLAACVITLTPAAPGETKAEVSPFAVTDEAALFGLLDLARPELAALRKAVEVRDWASAKQAWALHLATRKAPVWNWSRRDRPAFQRAYEAEFGGLRRFTAAADKVLARDFDLLGVRKQLDHKVEWLQGPIEWTHVLSRFGYWHELGLAYWGTGKPAYARDFAEHLTHWIESNPVPARVSNNRGARGSVWRTLEAGIRGQGWFKAMEFFMDAPEFDAETKYLMTRSLVEHARYLEAWVTTFRGGNWQVCEASGLATIGIMLPEFRDAAAWRDRGFRFLVEHMQKDVLPDGAHSEVTPGYHTWVMNQFTGTSLLARANGLQIPGLLDRHQRMFEFLESISRPDRTLPPVGDAGIGTSFRGSMGQGALLYQRPDFRYLAGGVNDEDGLWLFGPEAGRTFAALPSNPPAFTSVLLPDAKYAVMRTGWNKDDRYLLFDCAPWGGGHSHQDRLQVTVFAGRDLLVDPGMCSYDQPQSRDLRMTAAHNTVMIDGREQINANPELLAWHTGADADFASGRIEADGFSHQRSVLFVKPGYWVVVDHLKGEGEHEVTRLFHFPADAAAEADGNSVHTAFAKGMNLRVQAVDDCKLELRGGLVAAKIKAKVNESPVAAMVSKGKLPMTLCTVLLPYAEAKALPKISAVSSEDPEVTNVLIEFPDGRHDEIVIAAQPRQLRIGTRQATTSALCVRHGPAAESVIVIPAGIGAAK